MKLTAERPLIDNTWKKGIRSPKLMRGIYLVILCVLALIVIIGFAMILSSVLQK